MRLKAFKMHVSAFDNKNVIMHNNPETPDDIVVVNMHPTLWARIGGTGNMVMTMLSEED
jgi:hypothetical protein